MSALDEPSAASTTHTPHLRFHGLYTSIGRISCRPQDSLAGPRLASEVLRSSTERMLAGGELGAALRLSCAYVRCALALSGRVACAFEDATGPFPTRHDESSSRQHRQLCWVAGAAAEGIVAYVPPEVAHFLAFAIRLWSVKTTLAGGEAEDRECGTYIKVAWA